MKIYNILATAVVCSVPFLANATPTSITYAVNSTYGTITVTGTITTDGATGVLADSDILHDSFTVVTPDGTNIVDDGGEVESIGGNLTATSTSLSYNFGSGSGFLLFFGNVNDTYLCYQSSGCYGPDDISGVGTGYVYEFSTPEAGTQVIAGVGSPATTPEPSSLILLGTGVLSAVGAGRRRLFAR